jgi:hypothetical protein
LYHSLTRTNEGDPRAPEDAFGCGASTGFCFCVDRMDLTMANALAQLLLLVVLGAALAAVVVPGVLFAQTPPSVTAPAGEADSPAYWTEERMRKARPHMPTVDGRRGSGPSSVPPTSAGPPEGSPAQEPVVEPEPPPGNAKRNR